MVKVRRRKGRNGFQVDIVLRLPDGTRVRERVKPPCSTHAAALRWGQQREATLFSRGGQKPEAAAREVPTLGDFTEQFMTYSKTNNKPSTIHAKEWLLRVHLIPAFGAKRLDAIGAEQIERYKATKLDEGYVKKSINNHLTALRKLLNLAVEWNKIDRAPKVKGFKLGKDTVEDEQYLTFEESDRFLQAATPEWKPLLVLAIRTGLRAGELLALRWQDVDLVAGQLVVRRTLWQDQEGPPKGGRTRPVPLSDETVATLKAHRHLRGPYVFCDEVGSRLTHSIIKDVVPATCRRAGLAKRITTHGLRHTFASHLAMRGVSLKTIQELLGHESFAMTLRYAHLSPDVRRDAVQLLDGSTGARGTRVAPSTQQ
jgi:integrase